MAKRVFGKVSLFIVGVFTLGLFAFDSATESRYFEIAKNLEILSSVYAEVNRYYVDDIDPGEMMTTGIDAMLESLDPYTTYIPEEKIEDYRFISTNEYGGIGAVIGNREGKVLVIMPYEGFPAYEAGLKIGDEIVQIDDVKLDNNNSEGISKLLKGQSDTQVELKIRRFGVDSLIPYTLTRKKIKIDNVPYYGMVTEDVGYFKLTTFTTDASKEIRNALKELKKQGATKFVFDLRGNTGGLLKEAIDISNLFVPKGQEIVSTRGKSKRWTNTYYANSLPVDTEAPLVVLVNGRSASASEIVSGVIQDYDRGILIGKKTFGKGLVQATMPTVFNSQVKVTTAKYYIPSGRCIQAIDYSLKDENGGVHKIPDSLLVPFKTSNGRVVYDGAGVRPDVLTLNEDYPEVVTALLSNNMFFDYATEYYYSNPEIGVAKSYQVDDETYAEFVDWVTEKDFEYEMKVESDIEHLFSYLENQDDLNNNLQEELNKLDAKIEQYKKEELTRKKKVLKRFLAEEIVARYYFEKGVIENSFQFDPDILEAVSVLGDSTRYNSILKGE